MISRRRFLVICGAAGGAAAATMLGVRLLPGEGMADAAPPTIRYGAESCAACGMVIDDARFAAAWTAGGKGRRYDDIGCLVTDLLKHPTPPGARVYVHDLESEAWLAASDATYLMSPAIRTPMAYGIAATATPDAAERLAKQYQARVQAWDAVVHAPVNGRS